MTVDSASTTICTLFDGGDYHLGAAAMLNSLLSQGFEGTVVLGLRGDRPPWLSQLESLLPGRVSVVEMPGTQHLTFAKADILRICLERADCTAALYLDPDIYVNCPFELIETWIHSGIALVRDVNDDLPAGHPIRLRWQKQLDLEGLSARVPRNHYVNAGMIGLPREALGFLDTLSDVLRLVMAKLATDLDMKTGGATSLFHTPDQDALNIALMIDDRFPVNEAGSDAMGFRSGLALMHHGVGRPKPWERADLSQFVNGFRPSPARLAYLRHAQGPLTALPVAGLRRDARLTKALSGLSRFYSR